VVMRCKNAAEHGNEFEDKPSTQGGLVTLITYDKVLSKNIR